jgi:quercetin dioxygenase-like cupin family protein
MKVIHYEEADSYEPEKDWKRVSLCNEDSVSVEHFTKPPHHASAMHHHPSAQVCIVTKGKMAVRTADGREEILGEGDAAFFAGNEPHQVINLLETPSVGVDIFCPGRSFDFWLQKRPEPS